MPDSDDPTDPRASYDSVADEYVRRFRSELDHKPFDRERLDAFAQRLRGAGPVADVGCGPGHIAAYLAERGLDMTGLDLSPGMIEQARALAPQIPFRVADMRELAPTPGGWAGLVAFYSIIHIPREEVADVLRGFARALRPGGLLLLCFHIGEEVRHLDRWWERDVSVDFVFFTPDEMRGYLDQAGFELEELRERAPYAEDVEGQTRRCYVLARRPGGHASA